MDLPSLSFHAPLEEKWDEEEEPEEVETFLKVVPPSYYHYLDMFSKMKAEKPPPYNACDHNIELEGLLPPFQLLKEEFTSSPILSHFNTSLPTIVETGTSYSALGSVISQVNYSGKNLLEFYSHKLPQAELNYEIHDKELLGIFWALKRCGNSFCCGINNRKYLEGEII
ncbi:hypothetical protein O181_099909, partial [Austropuccinia psidii MF-1]|nr:hypothetical protein [Austropuccinia psidii MF-1]